MMHVQSLANMSRVFSFINDNVEAKLGKYLPLSAYPAKIMGTVNKWYNDKSNYIQSILHKLIIDRGFFYICIYCHIWVNLMLK